MFSEVEEDDKLHDNNDKKKESENKKENMDLD